jgi:hypothetical protein
MQGLFLLQLARQSERKIGIGTGNRKKAMMAWCISCSVDANSPMIGIHPGGFEKR